MKDLNIIGAEVYAVISNVSEEKQNKIPAKVWDTFKKYERYTDGVTINPNLKFEEQNISKEAKDVIFAIAFNYWLTEEEKKDVFKKLQDNEKTRSIDFNPDSFFNRFSDDNDETKSEFRIVKVEKKENWMSKLVKKIKNFFRKRR